MKRTEITIYTKLGKIEKCDKLYAIKDDDVIKYIDLENNIMVVDMKNNLMTRENSDYIFNFDFNREEVLIVLKKLKMDVKKRIKTMHIMKDKKGYLIRYLLLDEQQLNEYYIKF